MDDVCLLLIERLLLADIDLALAMAHHRLIQLVLEVDAVALVSKWSISLRWSIGIHGDMILLSFDILIILAQWARIRIIIHS